MVNLWQYTINRRKSTVLDRKDIQVLFLFLNENICHIKWKSAFEHAQNPAHVQSIRQDFALQSYILLYLMILLVD